MHMFGLRFSTDSFFLFALVAAEKERKHAAVE